MLRVAKGGVAVEGEVWALTPEAFGRIVAGVPKPLSVGTVEMADGRPVKGFLCEAAALPPLSPPSPPLLPVVVVSPFATAASAAVA